MAEAVTSAFRDANSSILVLSQSEVQSHTAQLTVAPAVAACYLNLRSAHLLLRWLQRLDVQLRAGWESVS